MRFYNIDRNHRIIDKSGLSVVILNRSLSRPEIKPQNTKGRELRGGRKEGKGKEGAREEKRNGREGRGGLDLDVKS